jgi:hypothetical protein
VNNPNVPVAYTRGWPLYLTVKLEVQSTIFDAGILRVTGPGGITGDGNFSIGCGTALLNVGITTTPLPEVVGRFEPLVLNWSAGPWEAGGPVYSLGSTQHTVFVTYGTPTGSLPTPRRVQHVCIWGFDSADPVWITDQIHQSLRFDPPFDGDEGTLLTDWSLMWHLMAGLPLSGECHHQARLMNLMIRMIGLPAGTEHKIRATTDADPLDVELTTAEALGIAEDLDGDGTSGDTDEILELIFAFDPPPPGPPPTGWFWNWNNFEGVLFSAGKWYAVWPSYVADSACGILQQLAAPEPEGEGAQQYWVYSVPGRPFYRWPTPVPFPGCP